MTKGEEDKDEKGKTTEDNCFSAGLGFIAGNFAVTTFAAEL